MLTILAFIIGGVGVFLLGMILMSEGLKAAAGNALQRILESSTSKPFLAFLSGLGATALVQSSSATTVTTIGFVSAGLLSFPSAVGVIIGANVGTTSTGWIVSLLGLKLNIGMIALPLIGVGALLRLLSEGRRAQLGMALAGFGLIFVGIDFLQEGMANLAHQIDLAAFSSINLGGRLLLVLVGAVMTVLLQSSSAAVALSITALAGGAINLHETAFLVIGQNLGTTVTAALATVGSPTPARRTALAHILFNAITGLLTFIFADPLLSLLTWLNAGSATVEPAVQIAQFHTLFNLLGAALFLPVVSPYAALITRLLPDRGPALTRHLDRSLLNIPSVAVEAADRAQHEIAALVLGESRGVLIHNSLTKSSREMLATAQAAITETINFLGKVRNIVDDDYVYQRRLALLHAGDHLERLIQNIQSIEAPVYGKEVQEAAAKLSTCLEKTQTWLHGEKRKSKKLVRSLAETSTGIAEKRRNYRAWLLAEAAAGRMQPDEAQRRLESMFWLDRLGYHAWRAMHHLAGPSRLGYRS